MLGWQVDRGIDSHFTVLDKAGRTDGILSRADFECDAGNNQYICPKGEPLKQFRRNYSDLNRGPTGKGVAKYQALNHNCQARPPKIKCCPKVDARQIARDIKKTNQYVVSMRLRKKVEMLLAHLKTSNRFSHRTFIQAVRLARHLEAD